MPTSQLQSEFLRNLNKQMNKTVLLLIYWPLLSNVFVNSMAEFRLIKIWMCTLHSSKNWSFCNHMLFTELTCIINSIRQKLVNFRSYCESIFTSLNHGKNKMIISKKPWVYVMALFILNDFIKISKHKISRYTQTKRKLNK